LILSNFGSTPISLQTNIAEIESEIGVGCRQRTPNRIGYRTVAVGPPLLLRRKFDSRDGRRSLDPVLSHSARQIRQSVGLHHPAKPDLSRIARKT
jgi:hypothetical protein